jgi:hypothetical protein
MSEQAIAEAALTRRRDAALRMVRVGGIMLACVPLVILVAGFACAFGGVPETIGMVVGAAYALVGGAGGIGVMIAGATRYRRVAALMYGWPRPLPQARLVERNE